MAVAGQRTYFSTPVHVSAITCLPIQGACSEKYEELCAISTTGELAPEEWDDLREHVAACGACSELLNEYTNLARIGMAKIGPIVEVDEEAPNPFAEKRAELRLIAALRTEPLDEGRELVSNFPDKSRRLEQGKVRTAAVIAAVAAVLLLSVIGAYQAGERNGARLPLPPQPNEVTVAPAQPDAEKAQLKLDLAAAEKSLKEIATRAADAEKRAPGSMAPARRSRRNFRTLRRRVRLLRRLWPA